MSYICLKTRASNFSGRKSLSELDTSIRKLDDGELQAADASGMLCNRAEYLRQQLMVTLEYAANLSQPL